MGLASYICWAHLTMHLKKLIYLCIVGILFINHSHALIKNNSLDPIKQYAITHKDHKALNEITLLIDILQNNKMDLQVLEKFISNNQLLSKALASKFNKFINPLLPADKLQKLVNAIPKKTLLNKIIQLDLNLESKHSNKTQIFKELENIWSNNIFEEKIEKYFFDKYKAKFSQTAIELKSRVLIMSQKIKAAKILIHLINNKHQKEYLDLAHNLQHLHTLQRLMKSANPKIQELASYFYINNFIKNHNNDNINCILINTVNTEFVSEWWKLRSIAIRDSIRQKDYNTALRLAHNNKELQGEDLFDKNWLVGFITYRLLKKPLDAVPHFIAMQEIAKTSYSKSQGCYWLGRAYKDANNPTEANYWFNLAATKYPNYFYGQLAILEVAENITYSKVQEDRKNHTLQDQITKLFLFAYALYKNGLSSEANQIIEYLATLKIMPKEVIHIVQTKSGRDMLPLFILFSKYLCNNGHPIIQSSYPNSVDFSASQIKHNKSLYLSIIRQESSFNKYALSPAGAKGMMQLMPKTEKECAQKLGIKKNQYHIEKYHVKIGAAYLDSRLEYWGNNYIAAIGSYNAGDGFMKKYISEYGDPHQFQNLYQVLDWIETMTYRETRLYVKKITENMINYQALIFKKNNAKKTILPLFNVNKISN